MVGRAPPYTVENRMQPVVRHSWKISIQEAKSLQNEFSRQTVLHSAISIRKIKTVAGADVSYSKKTNRCYAATVVLDFATLEVIEESYAVKMSTFPYVPGYLSFREGPSLVEAFGKLTHEPDVLIFDSQGIAHPRRFGLATHLGVIYDKPSIGCAKSRLVGEYDELDNERFAVSDLTLDGKVIGSVLKTKLNCKPVFISQGHKISLRQALTIIRRTTTRYRLPTPTRQAHILSNKIRTREEG